MVGTRSLRGVPIAVWAAAVVAVVAIGAGSAWLPTERDRDAIVSVQTDPTTTAPSAASTVPVGTAAAHPARYSTNHPDLDAAYAQCATDMGFDPGGVQVIVESGRPDWVKTARDVPARFHEPCFTGIGGGTQRHSSHGNPP